ncbi:MAG: glycosyltransferase family 2 protein [Candidatus Levybacteria bacterium]|nr:glycosyltransferase family 2 protein [Candidatus Levybacteria bacterium]
MKQKNYSITIAIPVYNEEETIKKVIENALSAVKKLTKEYELLLVNDGSTDGTKNIIEDYAKKNKNIRIINHNVNKGFTGAIKSCYRNSSKELIFLAPGDGQIDFRDLSLFVQKIQEGYDVVIGYRRINPEGFQRRLNSWVFHSLCRILLGLKFKEISTSILWKKKVLNLIEIATPDSSAMIEPEVILKAKKKGYKFAEVPITYLLRQGGKPKGANPKMIFITFVEMIKFTLKQRREK